MISYKSDTQYILLGVINECKYIFIFIMAKFSTDLNIIFLYQNLPENKMLLFQNSPINILLFIKCKLNLFVF